jgi:hypothetical protein
MVQQSPSPVALAAQAIPLGFSKSAYPITFTTKPQKKKKKKELWTKIET